MKHFILIFLLANISLQALAQRASIRGSVFIHMRNGHLHIRDCSPFDVIKTAKDCESFVEKKIIEESKVKNFLKSLIIKNDLINSSKDPRFRPGDAELYLAKLDDSEKKKIELELKQARASKQSKEIIQKLQKTLDNDLKSRDIHKLVNREIENALGRIQDGEIFNLEKEGTRLDDQLMRALGTFTKCDYRLSANLLGNGFDVLIPSYIDKQGEFHPAKNGWKKTKKDADVLGRQLCSDAVFPFLVRVEATSDDAIDTSSRSSIKEVPSPNELKTPSSVSSGKQ